MHDCEHVGRSRCCVTDSLLSLQQTRVVLFYCSPHILPFWVCFSLHSCNSNLTWCQSLPLLSLPFPLWRVLARVRWCLGLSPVLPLAPVCLVTHCSDTHLLASYNNSLPHTVHPLCSWPVLMQNTKELSPTFLPIRRHMDMSHTNCHCAHLLFLSE